MLGPIADKSTAHESASSSLRFIFELNAVHVRPATPSDFDAVTNLLSEEDIPHQNLVPSDMENLFVCLTSDEGWFDRISVLRTTAILPRHRLPDRSPSICGVVGLKMQGRVGLIYALVLDPEMQEDGDRPRLLNEIERRADERGIDRMYLLAGTDPGFFQSMGYQIVSHWEIPEALRSGVQAPGREPSDALPMRKRIAVSDREAAAV